MGKYDDLTAKLQRLEKRVASFDDDLDRHSAVLVKLHKRVDDLKWSKHKPADQPRGELTYVDDLACDGTEEIRWPSSIGSMAWGKWHRVRGEKDSALGQSYRYLVGPDVALHVDHAVQVRRLDDDGPFTRGTL